MDQITIETLQRIEDSLKRIEVRQNIQVTIKMVRIVTPVGNEVRPIKQVYYTPEGLVIDII